MQESVSLKYEPASEPLHISVTPEPSTPTPAALQTLGADTLRRGLFRPGRNRGVLSHLFFPRMSLARG